jgi:hypothetical protein
MPLDTFSCTNALANSRAVTKSHSVSDFLIGIGCVAGFILLLAFLPTILAKIFDPPAIRRIEQECQEMGLSDVRVKPYSGHYGVRFRDAAGKAGYAKCNVIKGVVRWEGKKPGGDETGSAD